MTSTRARSVYSLKLDKAEWAQVLSELDSFRKTLLYGVMEADLQFYLSQADEELRARDTPSHVRDHRAGASEAYTRAILTLDRIERIARSGVV